MKHLVNKIIGSIGGAYKRMSRTSLPVAHAHYDGWMNYPTTLISYNVKTGGSVNFLHGDHWSRERIIVLWDRLRKTQPNYTQAIERVLEEEEGLLLSNVVGSCDPNVIGICHKGKGLDEDGRPRGDCYCNFGMFLMPKPFFQAWLRLEYARRFPSKFWSLVRYEVMQRVTRGDIIPWYKPLRINGQGDTEPGMVPHIIKHLDGLQSCVCGFVRRPAVFLELIRHGFVMVALSIDRTIINRPEDLSIVKSLPSWATVVCGPVAEQEDFDVIHREGIKPRVWFRRHYGRLITLPALSVKGIKPANECPSYHDMMDNDRLRAAGTITKEEFLQLEEKVRSCFAGCRRCHSCKLEVAKQAFALRKGETLF